MKYKLKKKDNERYRLINENKKNNNADIIKKTEIPISHYNYLLILMERDENNRINKQ